MSTPIMDIDDVVQSQLRQIDEIEARIKRLKESHAELLEACRMWIVYFQKDVPAKNSDQAEQQGEDFTTAWYATIEAITKAEALCV